VVSFETTKTVMSIQFFSTPRAANRYYTWSSPNGQEKVIIQSADHVITDTTTGIGQRAEIRTDTSLDCDSTLALPIAVT